jgi:iron complex outermembrane receptor protein
MENSRVIRRTRLARRVSPSRLATLGLATMLVLLLARPVGAIAQEAPPTGSIGGRVVDEQGAPIAGAQVFLIRPPIATGTRTGGGYLLSRVPVGRRVLGARMLGFRPDSASVIVTAGQQATRDFTLRRDPLQLQTLVVTGTQTPRLNLDASVAVTTLTATEIEQAAPRSTTEMLRYVPGFTRVESSGGEVNENISIRGILGVEYVAFLEDGLFNWA